MRRKKSENKSWPIQNQVSEFSKFSLEAFFSVWLSLFFQLCQKNSSVFVCCQDNDITEGTSKFSRHKMVTMLERCALKTDSSQNYVSFNLRWLKMNIICTPFSSLFFHQLLLKWGSGFLECQLELWIRIFSHSCLYPKIPSPHIHLFLYSSVRGASRSTMFTGVFPVPVCVCVCVQYCTFDLVWDRVSLLHKQHSPIQLVNQLFLPPISAQESWD